MERLADGLDVINRTVGTIIRWAALFMVLAQFLIVLFRYVFGRLTLRGAFDYAAKRLGITASPILLPFAEAAIDVDNPSDKTLVETILKNKT